MCFDGIRWRVRDIVVLCDAWVTLCFRMKDTVGICLGNGTVEEWRMAGSDIQCHGMKQMERWAWAVAFAAAVIWGGNRDNVGPTSKEGLRTAAGTRPDRESELARDFRSKSSNRTEAKPQATRGRDLTRLLQNRDSLDRMARLLSLLASCDERGIAEVEAAWKELASTGVHLPAEEILLNHRLGQLRGRAALEGHTGTAEDFAAIDLLRGRFEGWLSSDPFGAKAWLEELPPGKFKDQMAIRMIATEAGDNPMDAMRQVSALPSHLKGDGCEAPGVDVLGGRIAAVGRLGKGRG